MIWHSWHWNQSSMIMSKFIQYFKFGGHWQEISCQNCQYFRSSQSHHLGIPRQGFPGILIVFTITNVTTIITSTTIILNNVTHRASDGQGQHCQSWRRPCRPGCPPSSWSKSPRRGRGGGGRLDKLAACCWSLGSLLVGDSKEIWICASAILNSTFESHISYIYI